MSLLLHKKFTWPDFGRVNIPIYSRSYAPGCVYTLVISSDSNPADDAWSTSVSIFITNPVKYTYCSRVNISEDKTSQARQDNFHQRK